MKIKTKVVKLTGVECYRCGYQWIPRKTSGLPKQCPSCKNPYWHLPKMKFVVDSITRALVKP